MITIKDAQLTPQTVNTGQNFVLSVRVYEADWSTIKESFTSWQDIKTSLTTWASLKDYNE